MVQQIQEAGGGGGNNFTISSVLNFWPITSAINYLLIKIFKYFTSFYKWTIFKYFTSFNKWTIFKYFTSFNKWTMFKYFPSFNKWIIFKYLTSFNKWTIFWYLYAEAFVLRKWHVFLSKMTTTKKLFKIKTAFFCQKNVWFNSTNNIKYHTELILHSTCIH